MMKQLTRKITIAAALAVVFAAPTRAEDAKAGDLVITQAWSRATPVGAKVAGCSAVAAMSPAEWKSTKWRWITA
jgi:copper(I)-binding protein